MSFEQTDVAGLARRFSEILYDQPSVGISASGPENEREQLTEDQLRNSPKFGDCHIFDYQKFLDESTTRLGSEKDVARLNYDFTKLNFNVHSDYKDLKKQQTLDALKKAAEKVHENSKCFVCCFLTHGKEGMLLMKDGYIKIKDILKCFSRSACKNLAGKPKIFIFQACRGRCCEEGVSLDSSDAGSEIAIPCNSNGSSSRKDIPCDSNDSRSEKDISCDSNGSSSEKDIPCASNGSRSEKDIPCDSSDSGSKIDIPDYLDFLLVYSTYEGNYSFKTLNEKVLHANHGSFFIDELCRTLEQFSGQIDLLQMLNIVNYRIAHFYLSSTLKVKTDKKKQMPSFTSRLRTKVEFNKTIPVYPSTDDTEYFESRRKESRLGLKSTKDPLEDKQMYNIQNERVKFLFLLNTKNNFGSNLSDCAFDLWSSVSARGYQREEPTQEKKLTDFLKKVADGECSKTDCLICFIACPAKGDYLYDKNGEKFSKGNIVEIFTGKACKDLRGKPKIFIFLMFSPPKKSGLPCVSVDSTDGDVHNMIPVHSDLLEVAITFQELKQLEGVMEKFCSIFGNESSEDFVSQLTRMNEELVKDYDFYSLSSKNLATFSLNSTLTKTLIL